MKHLLGLSLPLLALDQFTKWLILHFLPFGGEMPVVPGFFSIVHVTNTGAAFGVMQGNNAFFIALAVVAGVVVLGLFWRDRPSVKSGASLSGTTKIALSLLLSGITGNLVDRLLRGRVTDFLHFYHGAYEFPSFNVADSCICIAAGLLILGSLRSDRDRRTAVG